MNEKLVKSRMSQLWGRFTPARRRALYEQWVHDFASGLYRMAYRLCGQADTAEDLVQETFYHAWKDMDQLGDRRRARAWLFQILRFRYAHWVRDQSRRIRPVASTAELADCVADPSPSAVIRLAEQDALQLALDRLDEDLKTPLLMVFLQGLTCREAAETLNIPLGTVLSRIHRARERLRFVFESERRSESEATEGQADGDQPRRLRLGGGA